MNPLEISRLAVIAAIALGGLDAAQAATTGGTMAIRAVVEPSCRVNAAPLVFQGSRTRKASVDGESRIELHCTPDQAFSVSIDNGQNAGANRRRMIGAARGEYLDYELYSDVARTRVWGGGGAGAVAGITPRDGSAVIIPAYASITQETAAADSYADVVTITVQF